MYKYVKYFIPALVALAHACGSSYDGKDGRRSGRQDKKRITSEAIDSLWYKNAVIYTLDVEVYKDSDGDGIGDFNGLSSRLDYIDSLGVDVIWLAPFQPSPNKDDGYDVSDFYGIDRRLGTMEQFTHFIKEAEKRKIRIITDLVLNHSSDEHPWFKEARNDTRSPYRSWYVWSKKRPENYNTGMVFPGVQKETWTLDSSSGEYYFHRFYNFQPDLNAQNLAVQAELKKIIRFWLEKGLSGFRLDAVPFLIEVPETRGEKFEHQFEMLADLRNYIRGINPDAVILGEANVLPEETEPYFGKDGQAMQMMFNFFVNQHLFYALASGKADPLEDAIEATDDIPLPSQWGQFLRNHDELDLGRLSGKERNEVYERFGPEKNMQLYDRGIRRRLPPMLNNDTAMLKLANSLLFSLPSTPVIRYGDEIGMGDNLNLKERESVRTPMQWNDAVHGGFSTADRTVRPVIDTGIFSFRKVNVLRQTGDSNSLLTFTKTLVRLRKNCPEIAFGTREIIETGNPHVLVIYYQWENARLTVVHNLSDRAQRISLKNNEKTRERMRNLWSGGFITEDEHGDIQVSLGPHGFTWLRAE